MLNVDLVTPTLAMYVPQDHLIWHARQFINNSKKELLFSPIKKITRNSGLISSSEWSLNATHVAADIASVRHGA